MKTNYPYEVNFGYITSPGKFEGQRAYLPRMYEHYLDGYGTDLQDGSISVVIRPQDIEDYPELGERSKGKGKYLRTTVKFIITEQGFVEEQ